jgi:6-hydroxytryprostatin B O-methyltransferase
MFVSHDFYTPQTTKADIYILRHILHDWADGDVVRILQNLLPALTDGARVLVSEGVVPEPPAKRMNTLDEKQIR